jgi:ABC-type multidrug transport system fused ATPase/permease subunit
MSKPSKQEFNGVGSYLSYFSLFYKLAQGKFVLLPILMIIAGLFDSVGIALFLPLFDQLDSGAPAEHPMLQSFTAFLEAVHLNTFAGVLFLIALIFFTKFLVTIIQEIAIRRVSRDLYRSLSMKLLSGIASADYAKMYLKTTAGYISNMLTREVKSFLSAFNHYVGIMVSVLYIIVYLGFSLMLDAFMTVSALAIGVGLMVVFRKVTRLTKRQSLRYTEAAGIYQSRIIEFMQNYKYLKTTQRFGTVKTHMNGVVDRMTQAGYVITLISRFISSAPEPFAVILAVGLLYLQLEVWGNSFAVVAVLIMLFYRTLMRVVRLQSNWNGFFAASGALEVIPKALRDIEEHRELTGTESPGSLKSAISFRDVAFSYGDREVLKGLSISIKRNTTTALVGPSGGGKSTVLDLLSGSLSPSNGGIYYDDKPYDFLDISIVRANLGFVAQEVVMFHDTIANNISFFDEEVSEAKLHEVGCQASCHEFIAALPNGYETVVGDRGINLSVGQRQRIAIARELYRDPEILLFDEATSALDTESELCIQRSIELLKGKKTMMVIAHRLSTIKEADYIYVIDGGSVLEEGTFEELYNRDSSTFRSMCDNQSF